MLDAHCYARCAAACCHTADAMCFRIDYTSGISSNANASVCVRAGMGVCVLGKTPPLVTVHVCHLLYSEYGEAAVLATSVQK